MLKKLVNAILDSSEFLISIMLSFLFQVMILRHGSMIRMGLHLPSQPIDLYISLKGLTSSYYAKGEGLLLKVNRSVAPNLR